MLSQDKENKLIELFFHLDEFCIALEQWKTQTNRLVVPTRKPALCDSELMSKHLTIIVRHFYWSKMNIRLVSDCLTMG